MKILSFTNALSAAYLSSTPKAKELDNFNQALKTFIDKTNPNESEEHNKNLIPTFLQAFAYQDKKYEINTAGNIDLAISKEGYVEVLIKVKRPNSKVVDMVRCDDMNRKALGELLLDYMQQVNPGENAISNPCIKHCIITNNTEWFMIDSHFIKDIAGHKEIVKAYKEIDRDGMASSISPHEFYTIVKEIIQSESLLEPLEFVYINFEETYSTTQLRDIYKLFTPRHLLKELRSNDSNKQIAEGAK